MNIKELTLNKILGAAKPSGARRWWPAKPLALRLDGAPCRFANPRDFDFAISARSSVPGLRMSELYLRPALELDNEIKGLKSIEARLSEALAGWTPGRDTLARSVLQMGPEVISKDHGWRSILTQLASGRGARAGEWLALAVVRYLDYLDNRRRAVAAVVELRAPARTCAAPAKETQIIDIEEISSITDLTRLPPGQAVTMRLPAGREVGIRLARHPFSLTHGRRWTLVADSGQRYELHDGVNTVGRSRRNHVAVDSGFRNVSRQHLVVQPLGADLIRLTDVSSCGTFVPPAAIAS